MNHADTFMRVAGTNDLRRDLRARSVRGAVYVAAGNGGEFVLRLASTIVLARVLVPEHFGLIGMVTALTAIAGQFSQLGLSTVTVQRRDINHRQITNLFWINVAIGAGLTTLFCGLSPLISAFYGDARLGLIAMAVSTAFLWAGVSVQHEALLARQMKQAPAAFVRLAASVLSVGLAVVLAVGEYGYWALVWQEVARGFLTAVGAWLFCPWRPGLPDRSEDIRSLLRFGADLTLTQVFYAVIMNIDRLLIGRLFGASPLGLYRQAQQLIMAPLDQLNGPIGSVSQPGLSMLQDDPARYRRYYQKMVFLIALTTMPMAAFAALYAEELTLVFLGEKWIEAAPFFRIFALAALIRPVLGTAGTVLITTGQSRRLVSITFVSQVTLLVFIAAGIGWGAKGVALAQLVTPAVLLLPNLHYSFAGTPVTLGTFFHAIRTPVVASAVMVGGLAVLRGLVPEMGSVLSLSAGCVAGGILYGVTCLLQPSGRAQVGALVADMAASLQRSPAGAEARSLAR
jgi:O-antigen/teichoic acid export membrane protein